MIKNPEPFNIEKQFQAYCQRVGLDLSRLFRRDPGESFSLAAGYELR